MRYVKFRISALLILLLSIVGGVAKAQSQATLNDNASKQYQAADKELNAVYRQIIKDYSSKPVFIRNLKAAQRAWIKLRTADLAARFPSTGGGSATPMCKAMYLENITRDRTKYLRAWVTGIPEGDVCSGSIKIGQP